MRILYIVSAFPRRPGDVITPWLTETIVRLRERGVVVEVLAPSYRGLPDQNHAGIPVHRFRYAPGRVESLTHDQTAPDRLRDSPLYGALVPGYLAAGSVRAAKLARSGGFDALHCFWPLPHGLIAFAARAVSGVPVISTFFGVELTWLRRDLPFLAPIVRRIIRGSDAVTVISSHTASEVRALAPGTPLKTIPFGAAAPVGEALRPRRDGSKSAPFQLLFVGRLVERKGVTYLLRAVASLRDQENVRLVIVGDGPFRERLERESAELGLENTVAFVGFVAENELAEHFSEADAFVLPAVEDSKGDVEGLGVVLIEAILNDRPVIASASGGITDIVLDEKTGLLVPPADVEALAGAISRIIRDPSLRERLITGAREHVERTFGWGRIIDQLVELYAEVAGGRRHRRSGGHAR